MPEKSLFQKVLSVILPGMENLLKKAYVPTSIYLSFKLFYLQFKAIKNLI
jgi:hypothetical protein